MGGSVHFTTAQWNEFRDKAVMAVALGPSTGNIFYVDSGSGTDSAGKGLTKTDPVATVDYAINKCRPNSGDTVVVMEGHAETISSATTLVPDVAGVSIVGLGQGRARPTFSFSTAASTIDITGQNTRITNCVFLATITGVLIGIDVGAHDVKIDHCTFDYGGDTGEDFVSYIDLTTSDRCEVSDCEIYTEPAAAGVTSAIKMDDALQTKVLRNHINGTFTSPIISATTASTLVLIDSNLVSNGTTADNGGVHFTTACTGLICRNVIGTNNDNGLISQMDAGTCSHMANWMTDKLAECGTYAFGTTSA